MVIKILDHVTSTSAYKDGDVIFRLISKALQSGQDVTVSFSGIKSLPSAFINAAFVKLLEEFDFPYIQQKVEFIDSTRQINRLIQDRFYFSASGGRVYELVVTQSQRDKLQEYTQGQGGYQSLSRRIHDSIRGKNGKLVAHVNQYDLDRVLEAAAHGSEGGWQGLFRDIAATNPNVRNVSHVHS
jgi:hypothetical protein